MPNQPRVFISRGGLYALVLISAGVAAACGGAAGGAPTTLEPPPGPAQSDGAAATPRASAPPAPTPDELIATTAAFPNASPLPTPEPQAALPIPTRDRSARPTIVPTHALTLQGDERRAAVRHQILGQWGTNFNKKTVSLSEVVFTLEKDVIEPIDAPRFEPVSDPPFYMRQDEPVISLEIAGDARAYPLAMLMWHEIVNDTVGGVPVTVTFCPLCNTAIAFERTVTGRQLSFGTSGNLRNSDLVMYDRETQSWWQQITGEAIVGDFAGTQLKFIPASIISWSTFAEQFPDGQVLRRELNEDGLWVQDYENPPYAGYDDIDSNVFAIDGLQDGRLPATARVLTVDDGETFVAYPFTLFAEQPVINDSIGDLRLVAFFDRGTRSPFVDANLRFTTVGSTTVFERDIDGRTLTFEHRDGRLVDLETGSVWSRTGRAESGPLAGMQLRAVVHANHFWFAQALFRPQTDIRASLEDLRPD